MLLQGLPKIAAGRWTLSAWWTMRVLAAVVFVAVVLAVENAEDQVEDMQAVTLLQEEDGGTNVAQCYRLGGQAEGCRRGPSCSMGLVYVLSRADVVALQYVGLKLAAKKDVKCIKAQQFDAAHGVRAAVLEKSQDCAVRCGCLCLSPVASRNRRETDQTVN